MNIDSVRQNTVVLAEVLRSRGMRLVGVPKVTLSHPSVALAMASAGALALGDSRIENLYRLRQAGYRGETMLLRAPSPSRCRETVEVCDVSLNSHVSTVRFLGEASIAAGKRHKIILMVDMGDLREGVLPADAVSVAGQMASVKGIQLIGIGANWGCYGGVMPTSGSLESLVNLKTQMEKYIGIQLSVVSGGNSANVKLLMDGGIPQGVTELRLGESILLGTESTQRQPIQGCTQDAFTVKAEVIEVLLKPSKPFGQIGQNAFGVIPHFADRGARKRAICALGLEDTDASGLLPLDAGVFVLGASSDHLILDVQEAKKPIQVGSVLSFRPNYSALLRACTSPFVEKVVIS